MEIFSWITTLLTQLFPTVSRDSKICDHENIPNLVCSLCDLGWSQAQDKTTRLWYEWIKMISFLQTKMRKSYVGKTEYSVEYLRVLLWTRISVFHFFFLSVKTEVLLYRQILFVWVSCRCDFPGASQYFLYGQKSWPFSEWKRMVDKVNSACFSSLEITSKPAYTFFIEKCGFWKG